MCSLEAWVLFADAAQAVIQYTLYKLAYMNPSFQSTVYLLSSVGAVVHGEI